ncbi:hypothetical protein HDU93_005366, partial [Gonapodya sp. JEL0774]
MTQPREILRALDDVVRQGKVLFTGISDTPAWEVARMNTLAECNNMTPFSVYQGKYNLGERDMDRDIMPMCRELGVGVIPWGATHRRVKFDEKDWNIVDELEKIATKHKCAVPHVAVAWVLQKPNVPALMVGCRTVDQLRDNIKALDVRLDEQDVKRLDEASSCIGRMVH